MFDRIQRPFLTVETGEAYQPIRLMYDVADKNSLLKILDSLKCIQKNTTNTNSWNWYWQSECDDIHFESLDSFKKNPNHPVRLGTLTFREDKLYLNLPSFKRACLAVPFFHKLLPKNASSVHMADFINKVFGLDERLPHGFSELFKEEELEKILKQRVDDYHKVKEQCEHAATAEEAIYMLSDFTKAEAKKKLPYAERYVFEVEGQDPEVIFLAFYIYLRGRELVAIKRWWGQAGYSLSDAVDETIEQVFGNLGIDIIE
jgi:hypothetical protein